MAVSPACQTFLPMLSPFVDGELPPDQRQTVERHIAVCKDCTGRVADFRAEAGLVRLGMEMLADEADFKDFANKVMAKVTPHKLPLLERWKLSLSEMFQHQRGPLFASLAGAAAALAIAVPLLMSNRVPTGYAGPQMAVQSVEAAQQAHVAPVVMTTSNGESIVWLVEQDPEAPSPTGEQPPGQELDTGAPTQENPKPLNPTRPEGGPL